MLESIRIYGFRKYDDLKIGNFNKINFILGPNNVGKTSVLEAIFAWACGQNVIPFLNVPLARGRYSGIQNPYWIMEEILASVKTRKNIPLQMSFCGIDDNKEVKFDHTIYPSELLTDYDSSYKNYLEKVIPRTNDVLSTDNPSLIVGIPGVVQFNSTIIARWEVLYNNKKTQIDIMLPQSQIKGIKPYKQAKFIDVLSHTAVSENVHMYASLKRENLLNEVEKEIKKVFPEIEGFDMIPYPDGSQAPVSVIKTDGTMLPLYAYGDGIQKWFYVMGAIAVYKNSMICIDEIDSGFHPSAQVDFSLNMVRAAVKNGVQLFVTTHNIEFMDNMLKAVLSEDRDIVDAISIITLKDSEGDVKVRKLNAEDAYESRTSFNLELR